MPQVVPEDRVHLGDRQDPALVDHLLHVLGKQQMTPSALGEKLKKLSAVAFTRAV